MPLLEIFDETLDINSAGNYFLSLQMSYYGISFCIFDTVRSKYIMMRSYTPDENSHFNLEEVSEVFKKDDFFTRKYRKVNLVMPSDLFTPVPSPLYDPGRKDEYLIFNYGADRNNIIFSNRIPENDIFIVFAASRSLFELASGFFPGIFPYHHVRPLFSSIIHSARTAAGNYIHLHIENDFFTLIIFSDQQLRYLNAFKYRNISDIMYYVLNVFRTLGLSGEETLHLSGQTESYDDLTSTISMYVKHFEFAVPSGQFTFSHVFNEIPLHNYINLFNVLNCE